MNCTTVGAASELLIIEATPTPSAQIFAAPGRASPRSRPSAWAATAAMVRVEHSMSESPKKNSGSTPSKTDGAEQRQRDLAMYRGSALRDRAWLFGHESAVTR